MDAFAVPQDRVETQAAAAGLPVGRMFVVAEAFRHGPGVAGVEAAEQRRRLDAAPEFVRSRAGLQRPDVRQGAAVALGEQGRGGGLLERGAEIVGAQYLHAEKGVAAGSVEARGAAAVDQSRIDPDAGSERTAQSEPVPCLVSLGDEQPLLGAYGYDDAFRHGCFLLRLPEKWKGRRPAPAACPVRSDRECGVG